LDVRTFPDRDPLELVQIYRWAQDPLRDQLHGLRHVFGQARHLLPVHVIEELTLSPDGVIGDLHRVNRADGNRTIMTGVPLPGPLKRERGRGGSDRTGSEPTPVPGAHANRGEHRPQPGTHAREPPWSVRTTPRPGTGGSCWRLRP